MAYADFYLDGTNGNDLNSGSSTGTPVASVSGATLTFSALGLRITASGTPFSGVSVGQWASIYTTGQTVTHFVGQILAVNSGGASIDVADENSTQPICFGLGDSINGAGIGDFASGQSVNCIVGGPWKSLAILGQGPLGGGVHNSISATIYYSVRINVKSGTYPIQYSVSYPNTTQFLVSGSASHPIFWRGYNTSPGDLDNVANPGTHPVFTGSTPTMTIQGYNRFENIDFSGSANPLITVSGLGVMLTRCRITATSGAITINGAGFNAWACYFATTSTTVTNVSCASNGGLPTFTQCVIQGGLYNATASYTSAFLECVFKNPASHNILASTVNAGNVFHRCTFYNSGTTADGILTASFINYHSITFCIFDTIKRYAVNSTNSSFVQFRLAGNDYSSITSGQLNGVYESYQHAAITESASPFTSASGNDFTLVSTSTAVTQTFVFEMP